MRNIGLFTLTGLSRISKSQLCSLFLKKGAIRSVAWVDLRGRGKTKQAVGFQSYFSRLLRDYSGRRRTIMFRTLFLAAILIVSGMPAFAENQAPVLNITLPDLNTLEDSQFTYQFSSDTFYDPDPGDELIYTATLDMWCTSSVDCFAVDTSLCGVDYCTLPTWLTFDSSSRMFTGIPDNDAAFDSPLNIRVVAIIGTATI